MRRIRGFLAGYLGLVALSVIVQEGPSKKTAGLLGWVSSAIDRALSPGVAAIPDYAHGGGRAGQGGAPTTAAARFAAGESPRTAREPADVGSGGSVPVGALAAGAVDQSVAILGTRPTTNLYQSGH